MQTKGSRLTDLVLWLVKLYHAKVFPESIQTTAEDVLELPLLPPEDVATPSKHKLSDQSTHNNPPEDVATPRTATTRAQSLALSEAAENRPGLAPAAALTESPTPLLPGNRVCGELRGKPPVAA